MGRSSSTGRPYLIQRPDAGQFTYHRAVAAPLAPFVTGEVLLAWNGRTRKLDGKATIKISLATGDVRTAHQRWLDVHVQVDALVQLAEVQSRTPQQGRAEVPVTRLDQACMRAMAEQAYHDVLATDDRTQVEPGYLTPAAAILLRLAGLAGRSPRAGSALAAEQAARRAQHRVDGARLLGRETWIGDRPIVESELDVTGLDLNPERLRVGDRLAPELVEALARGIRVGDIPSEVEARLKENGIELPPGHVDRRALALAITRAKLRGLADVAQRDGGAPIETPLRPASREAPAAAATGTAPTLFDVRERWIAMVRPSRKQQDDNARYVRLFVSLHGDLPVDRITGQHVRDFRDALLLCPRNAPKGLTKASVAELTSWATANPKAPTLGRNTINNKALGAISTLLVQARKEDHVTANPTEGQKLPTRSSDTLERQPHTVEELNALFRTSVYAANPVVPKAGGGWAAWWLPLLALFTGCRLEELGQALVSDVRQEKGISFLEITTLGDDDASGKALKSNAARRRVPLHATLIRLGFLDYVGFLKARGTTRLFPELREYRGRYTKDWSKWWGRWLDKHVTDDPSRSFHSLRHSWIAELRRLKVPVGLLKELAGHAQTDVTSGYGRRNGQLYGLADLDEQIQRLSFEGVDLEHLVGRTPWRSG